MSENLKKTLKIPRSTPGAKRRKYGLPFVDKKRNQLHPKPL